ncbi:SOS response-associated peptidase [Pseudomonas sp. F(2018)]|uniref:SOS response-associated peptidase n=1 Tax=Pseudomonas sp. F(2018) TaxID=2502240 RepID=UPI0010F5A02B|nr:SOS response-associated peptidase family protein [Pseudomonas sp. F(2018)]
MCGRIAQYSGIREFVDALSGLPQREQFRLPLEALQHYNIAPTGQVATLHLAEGTLLADLLPWGWKPHWATRQPNQNARVESVATLAFWRNAWPHRAIIPIDGWYEWVDEGGPKKQPYFIRRRDGRPTLCATIGNFPGLDGDAPPNPGTACITADALGGMLDVHDRRPITLAPELAWEWLDHATPKERAEQMVLHQGEPADEFEWYKVGLAVGNSRNQGSQLIQPLAPLGHA